MTGMNRITGKRMNELDHIQQSVMDILTTPIGSRVMRREYGSLLFELVDAPGNPTTQQKLIAATVTAITHWEPRIRINRVQVLKDASNWTVNLDAVTQDGRPMQLVVPLIKGVQRG